MILKQIYVVGKHICFSKYNIKMHMSMTSICHNHMLKTNRWHREEETQTTDSQTTARTQMR